MITRKVRKTLVVSVLLAACIVPASKAYAAERIFYLSYTKAGLASFKAHADKIDVVAPQSYELNPNLEVVGSVDPAVLSIAAKNKVKVMPLIVNSGFSQDIVHRLLISTSSEDSVVSFLLNEAAVRGYSGWQFDFEHIASADRDLYSSFVERAAAAFSRRTLTLSIAVVVRSADVEDSDFFRNWASAFDYGRLARSADFLSIMTYDDPTSQGPTASLPFVRKTLSYIRNSVPADKISLGIPLYYWSWSFDPLTRVRSGGTYSRVVSLRSRYVHTEGFDETLGVPWLLYYSRKKPYVVWFENAKSFKGKLDLAKTAGLRGFSAWVLGDEDPRLWELL